jgi:hypothetical protein
MPNDIPIHKAYLKEARRALPKILCFFGQHTWRVPIAPAIAPAPAEFRCSRCGHTLSAGKAARRAARLELSELLTHFPGAPRLRRFDSPQVALQLFHELRAAESSMRAVYCWAIDRKMLLRLYKEARSLCAGGGRFRVRIADHECFGTGVNHCWSCAHGDFACMGGDCGIKYQYAITERRIEVVDVTGQARVSVLIGYRGPARRLPNGD